MASSHAVKHLRAFHPKLGVPGIAWCHTITGNWNRDAEQAGSSSSSVLPPQDEGLEAQIATGLPLAERCKNLLSSNWRCQLSTIKAGSDNIDVNSLHSSLVPYTLVDSKPVVWLPEDDAHQPNLLMDNRSSLMFGSTDPADLLRLLSGTGKVPARTIIFGELEVVDPAEVGYVQKRAASLLAALKASFRGLASPLASIAKSPEGPHHANEPEHPPEHSMDALSDLQPVLSHPSAQSFMQRRLEQLEEIVLPDRVLTPYMLLPRSLRYADMTGDRHTVPVQDLPGAATDPMAPLLPAFLEGVNRHRHLRETLILFVEGYLGVHVKNALLVSADRWGMTILGLPSSGSDSQAPWREFRLSFHSEVKDLAGFWSMFRSMEQELLSAMEA